VNVALFFVEKPLNTKSKINFAKAEINKFISLLKSLHYVSVRNFLFALLIVAMVSFGVDE